MLTSNIVCFRTKAPTAAAPQTAPLHGAVTFEISDVDPDQNLQKARSYPLFLSIEDDYVLGPR